MGGTSTQSQNQQQQSTANTTQNSTTAPWAAAQPALQGILSQLQGQLGNTGLTQGQSSAINGLSDPALQGKINQAYGQYYNATNPLASNTNYDPMSTPGIGDQLAALKDQITTGVNGQFAAAGRDGSGYNQKALGQGLAAGLAPVLTNQYNQNVTNQQNAANNLFGAAGTNVGIQSGLLQQALAAQTAGQQLPFQNLGLLANIGVPIAGLGSQSNGTSNTTSSGSGTMTGTADMSGAQQFATILGGLGSLWPKAPIKFG